MSSTTTRSDKEESEARRTGRLAALAAAEFHRTLRADALLSQQECSVLTEAWLSGGMGRSDG